MDEDQFPFQRYLPQSPLIPTPLEAVAAYLTENEWNYELVPEKRLIHTGITGKNSSFRILLSISDEDDILEMVTLIPNRIPLEKRAAIAELCLRINYTITIGRIDMDYDDGEMRVYTGAPFVRGVLPEEVIHRCIAVGVLLADSCYTCIMSVLYGNTSPEAAAAALYGDEDKSE